MCELVLGSGVPWRHHVQFIAIRRIVLILCGSSKSCSLMRHNGGISYRGIHFDIHWGVIGGGLSLSERFCHGGIAQLESRKIDDRLITRSKSLEVYGGRGCMQDNFESYQELAATSNKAFATSQLIYLPCMRKWTNITILVLRLRCCTCSKTET